MGVRQSYNLFVYLQGSGNNSEGRPSSLIEVDFGIPILDTYIYVAKQLEITCVCVCGEREREREREMLLGPHTGWVTLGLAHFLAGSPDIINILTLHLMVNIVEVGKRNKKPH